MTREFDHTRAAFSASVPGRILDSLGSAARSAWRTSITGGAVRFIAGELRAMPKAAVIRTIAVALLIAATAQPLLISLMPRTVAPAMPWPVFALVGVFAAAAAWQADAIVSAWPESRLARLLSPHRPAADVGH